MILSFTLIWAGDLWELYSSLCQIRMKWDRKNVFAIFRSIVDYLILNRPKAFRNRTKMLSLRSFLMVLHVMSTRHVSYKKIANKLHCQHTSYDFVIITKVPLILINFIFGKILVSITNSPSMINTITSINDENISHRLSLCYQHV